MTKNIWIISAISIFLLVIAVLPIHAQSTTWDYPDREFRVRLSLHPNDTERYDINGVIDQNFTRHFNHFNEAGTFDKNSLRLTEINTQGQTLDMNVAFQFDKAADYNATDKAYGDFIWLAKGTTSANINRIFYLYFDKVGRNYTDAQIPSFITFTDNVAYLGQSSFKIVSPHATYYYHKQGGGFASMIDSQGNDWISYNPTAGSAGSYRGIPNMVYPEGMLHPGNTQSTSTLIASGPLRVSFITTTLDNNWETRWDIYPSFAVMTLNKHSHDYWFLYEGTPGGTFSTAQDYMVDSQNTKTTAATSWTRALPIPEWIYFGDEALNRVLYLGHTYPQDGTIDSYRPMENNMTVFGFGRDNNTPLINRPPAYNDYYVMGFAESKIPTEVTKIIRSSFDIKSVGSPLPEKLTPPTCTLKANGDGDCNGVIDSADFEVWRKEFMKEQTTIAGDFDSSGVVNLTDFEIWRKNRFL